IGCSHSPLPSGDTPISGSPAHPSAQQGERYTGEHKSHTSHRDTHTDTHTHTRVFSPLTYRYFEYRCEELYTHSHTLTHTHRRTQRDPVSQAMQVFGKNVMPPCFRKHTHTQRHTHTEIHTHT